MSTPLLCVVAGLAMISQDVLLTLMTQAEARNRSSLAGVLDSVGFLAQFATYGISIDTLLQHGVSARTLWVLASLTLANYVGTGLGTKLGSRWIHAASIVEKR